MPGYHLTEITKGKVGEFSKIEEEVAEVRDAIAQDIRIMILVELSDLIGAIELYLKNKFPDMCLGDLLEMKDITHRAFESGARKSG